MSITVNMTWKKNNAFRFVVYLFNLGICKLPSLTVVANLFVVLHACTLRLSTVDCHENSFAIWNVEHCNN